MVVRLQPFLLFVALSLPLGPAGGDLRFRVIIAMGISKISRNKRFFALLRNEVRRPKGLKAMTKQRFVIGEFISVTMNSPMLFCFVIGE